MNSSFEVRITRPCRPWVHKTILTVVLCVFLVFPAGCGKDNSRPPEDPPKTLRFGTPMDVKQVNLLGDSSYSFFAMLATHETLVRFDADMNPVPQLAESWTSSADGKTWSFRLKENVRWHDGKPLTAEDVKFTYGYMAAHHSASAWLNDLVSRIDTDGSNVTFVLTKPYSRFLINVGFIIRILPRHVWQDVENPLDPGKAAITVGCGPFVFDRFDSRGKLLTFLKNKAYHGTPPSVERLVFVTDLTLDSLTLSLTRGEIDAYYKYASGFPPAYLPRLEADKHLRILRSDGLGIPAALGFNLKKSPTSILSFRKALTLAVDYEKIGQSLLGTSGKIPTLNFAPPASPYYLQGKPLSFSPETCRLLLKEAGFVDLDGDGIVNGPLASGGKNVTLKLLTRADLEGTDALLPILTHSFRKAGLSLSVERVDLSTWITRAKKGDHDLILFRTTPWGMVMDAGCGSGYFDSRRNGGGTLGNVDDPLFHRLCDRILENTNPLEEKKLNESLQRYYAEQIPALALCWAVNAYPASNRVTGWVINPIEGGLANRGTFARAVFKPSGDL